MKSERMNKQGVAKLRLNFKSEKKTLWQKARNSHSRCAIKIFFNGFVR
jgi:hypothetical protein